MDIDSQEIRKTNQLKYPEVKKEKKQKLMFINNFDNRSI